MKAKIAPSYIRITLTLNKDNPDIWLESSFIAEPCYLKIIGAVYDHETLLEKKTYGANWEVELKVKELAIIELLSQYSDQVDKHIVSEIHFNVHDYYSNDYINYYPIHSKLYLELLKENCELND